MSKTAKNIILAIVGIAIVVILFKPDLDFIKFGSQKNTFQTTPNAAQALDSSIKKGRPVFLEFYAEW